MNADYLTLSDYLERRPTRRSNMPIGDFAETLTISAGKYRGTKFKMSRAPYMAEPLKLMSPESNIEEVRLMWNAQSGKSESAVITTLYYAKIVPSEILYVSSDERQAQYFIQRRIEPAARRLGLEFRPQLDAASTRRTGNTSQAKDFDGGELLTASAAAASQLAASTKRVIICDEISRFRESLKEGEVMEIIYGRASQWGNEKKLFQISTPLEEGALMDKLYKEGDCREFWLPCIHCGAFQLLDFFKGHNYGLYYEVTKGGFVKKDSVVYYCQYCGQPIPESAKGEMLNNGEWRPSKEAISPEIASFHINGLYSPWISWGEMARKHQAAEIEPAKRKSFQNIQMGMPYAEQGLKPDIENVLKHHIGNYKSGEVPDQVAFLAAGFDIQRGNSNNPEYPSRIEMTVAGISSFHRIFVIEHKIFKGAIDAPDAGAFKALTDYWYNKKMIYRNIDNGLIYKPELFFMDSGDGVFEQVVFSFCQTWGQMFPTKGFGSGVLKKHADEYLDPLTGSVFLRFRKKRQPDNSFVYEISTNYYKDRIYSGLSRERVPGPIQQFYFIEFPNDLSTRYYEQLLSEEKLIDGSYKQHGRNETLDCLCLCAAAGDAFINDIYQWEKKQYEARGLSEEQIETLTSHKIIIERMVAGLKKA